MDSKLYRDVVDRVKRILFRMWGNPFAEDHHESIAHALLLRWGIERLTSGRATFLKRAVTNRGIDLLRAQMRRRETPLSEAVTSRCEARTSPWTIDEQLSRVEEWLGHALEPRDRELLRHRLEGFRWNEVAQKVGSTSHAVRQRMYELRRRLRREVAA